MRIRWSLVLVTAAIFAVGAAAGMAIRNLKNGIYYSSLTEKEDLNFKDREDSLDFSQYRSVAFVPPEYGKLITVTGGPGDTLLWYEDAEGVIRNIPVDAQRLLSIRREGKRSS
jgi:hypothetical protein